MLNNGLKWLVEMGVLQCKLLQCFQIKAVSVSNPFTEGGVLSLIVILQRQHAHSI